MLEIELPEGNDNDYVFKIYDIYGRHLLSRNIRKTDGNKQNFNLTGLYSGHYIAQLIGSTNTFSTKLIVL